MNRLKPLDAIRGIAALIVAMFSHYHHFDHSMTTEQQPLYSVFAIFYDNGWHMVDLFFVLSGVVFSYVYGKKIKESKISGKEYAVFRFSRLYPLHLGTLIVVSALFLHGIYRGYGIFVYGESDVKYFFANVLFVQSGITPWPFTFNGPAWSISCEIVAYVLFFVILKYFYDKRLIIAMGLVVVGFLFRNLHTSWILVNMDIGRLLMGFFVGLLIYELLSLPKVKDVHLAMIVGFLIVSFVGVKTVRPSAWSYAAVVFLYPAIIIAGLRFNLLKKVLSLRPLTYLGDISYSVYLLHFPVQLAYFAAAQQFGIGFPYTSVGFFLTYGATVILTSVLSYEYFEKPVQARLREFFLGRNRPLASNVVFVKNNNEAEVPKAA